MSIHDTRKLLNDDDDHGSRKRGVPLVISQDTSFWPQDGKGSVHDIVKSLVSSRHDITSLCPCQHTKPQWT